MATKVLAVNVKYVEMNSNGKLSHLFLCYLYLLCLFLHQCWDYYSYFPPEWLPYLGIETKFGKPNIMVVLGKK